jgi:hypothetical protein
MKIKVNTQGTNQVVAVGVQGTNQVVAVGIQGPAGSSVVGPPGPAGPVGPAGIRQISLADDVNASTLADGSVLLYSTASSKWVATTQLNNTNTIINGGNF